MQFVKEVGVCWPEIKFFCFVLFFKKATTFPDQTFHSEAFHCQTFTTANMETLNRFEGVKHQMLSNLSGEDAVKPRRERVRLEMRTCSVLQEFSTTASTIRFYFMTQFEEYISNHVSYSSILHIIHQ